MRVLLCLAVLLVLVLPPGLSLSEEARKAGEKKYEELVAKSYDGSGFVVVGTHEFRKYTEGPRPYRLLLYLTSRMGSCSLCDELEPEVRLLGATYEQARNDEDHSSFNHRTFVLLLDGSRNYQLFQELGYKTVPHLVHLPPTKSNKAKKWERLLRDSVGLQRGWKAEDMAKTLLSRTRIKVEVERPPEPINWLRIILTLGTISFGVYASLTFANEFVRTYVQNSFTMLCVSLLFFTFTVSGGMYNRIRDVPFAGPNGENINRSNGTQYAVEGYIIGILNVLAGLALIFLNTRFSRSAAKGAAQSKGGILSGLGTNMAVLMALAALAVFWRSIINIYTIKNGGYRNGWVWP